MDVASSLLIDFETNFACLDTQIHDSALGKEVRSIAYRENPQASKSRKNRLEPKVLGRADEDDVTTVGLAYIGNITNQQGAASHHPAAGEGMERVAERVRAEYTHADRLVRVGESAGGEFDKAGETGDTTGFHLIFIHDGAGLSS